MFLSSDYLCDILLCVCMSAVSVSHHKYTLMHIHTYTVQQGHNV